MDPGCQLEAPVGPDRGTMKASLHRWLIGAALLLPGCGSGIAPPGSLLGFSIGPTGALDPLAGSPLTTADDCPSSAWASP